MINGSEVGQAIKLIVQRLKELSDEEKNIPSKPLPVNCYNCRYRHGKEGYDYQRGMYYCIQNWCDKDRNLMDTGLYNMNRGKGHEFISNCEFYEEGQGTYDRIPNDRREY